MTGPAEQKQSHVEFKLLTRLFFRLLPYQALLIVINAVNGIVDGLVASNAVGAGAMNAIGLYTPMTHFLFALSITMVSGSQLLYGLYRPTNRRPFRASFLWTCFFPGQSRRWQLRRSSSV